MIDEKKIEDAAIEAANKDWISDDCFLACEGGVKSGINWFLDNLWHEASEEPKENEWIMTEYIYNNDKKFVKLDSHKPSYYPWQQKIINEKITRWLYIEDLLKGGSHE